MCTAGLSIDGMAPAITFHAPPSGTPTAAPVEVRAGGLERRSGAGLASPGRPASSGGCHAAKVAHSPLFALQVFARFPQEPPAQQQQQPVPVLVPRPVSVQPRGGQHHQQQQTPRHSPARSGGSGGSGGGYHHHRHHEQGPHGDPEAVLPAGLFASPVSPTYVSGVPPYGFGAAAYGMPPLPPYYQQQVRGLGPGLGWATAGLLHQVWPMTYLWFLLSKEPLRKGPLRPKVPLREGARPLK